MEQITISISFAEELVKAEGKKILQDHMAECGRCFQKTSKVM